MGELCGHFFDINGTYAAFDINKRIIGLDLEQLRAVPHVLAVARGRSKVKSIFGALRGRFLTVLVTDDITAQGILGLTENAPAAAKL